MHTEYSRNSKKKIKKNKNRGKNGVNVLKSFALINELIDELIF